MSSRFKNILVAVLILFGAVYACAQQRATLSCDVCSTLLPLAPQLHVALPQVTPPLALELFLGQKPSGNDVDYRNQTLVHAELPELNQKGDYELVRAYSAQPRSLRFVPVSFTGDGFVKNNVILRVLQSEVDRVEKDNPKDLAISEQNYKFAYKGAQQVNGKPTYVFHVKPRRKRQGLFKGKIYLDTSTGHLRRAEGSPIKSPSLFIKHAEFIQDFDDFGPYTLPTRMHSTAKTRLVGRAVLEIVQKSYQFPATTAQPAEAVSQSF